MALTTATAVMLAAKSFLNNLRCVSITATAYVILIHSYFGIQLRLVSISDPVLQMQLQLYISQIA